MTTGTYEAEVRRAVERALVDRVMWLASSAPNAQVRAIASMKLQDIARLRTATSTDVSERAHRGLLAADIKRFIERPVAEAHAWRWMTASPAPPGAPIGDMPQDWLARPPY